MTFNEKLKKVMQDLKISQSQLVVISGIGKSSISQYLSGKNIPTIERQKHIAISLGLTANYFEQEEPVLNLIKTNSGVIAELRTKDVGKLMRMNHRTVEEGLKQGVFPWGYAIKTSEKRHRYFINARRFAEIEGIEIPSEMVI